MSNVYIVMVDDPKLEEPYIGLVFSTRNLAEQYIWYCKSFGSDLEYKIREEQVLDAINKEQALTRSYKYVPSYRNELKKVLIKMKLINEDENWLVSREEVIKLIGPGIFKKFPYGENNV